jgi:hypothetical protein
MSVKYSIDKSQRLIVTVAEASSGSRTFVTTRIGCWLILISIRLSTS